MWGALHVVLVGTAPEAPTLKLDREIKAPPPPVATPAPQPPPAPRAEDTPARDAPVSIPQLLDRLSTPERKLETLPEFTVPLPSEAPPTPAPVPVPAPVPAPAIPAVPRVTPPTERPLLDLPPIPAPAPVPVIPSLPRVTTPPERTLRELPPIAAPAPTPVIPAVPREAPPVVRPLLDLPPVQVPATIAPPRLEALPAPTDRTAPQAATQLREMPDLERLAPPVRVDSLPSPPPSPFRAPPASAPATPDAPSSTYDPTVPEVDLDAVRRRAATLSREGSGQRAVLPFPMPGVPAAKSKTELAIENARKPDCKTAYKDMGLLAVVPLIANEFGEGNCRW